eukprot:gnl/MRDRNA2_/MRDRNA2_83914_c0_seq1.p1 gnl/MRDRNA2_/MRDRNA2_83914_c0~~gnl/MRDRNA2_/MRDRNA2_83914_c0_seq1.p1  ORF type:complete len:243 (+),score=49.32 gnl/MRDRNA2_/MRDRNA2_83914_c0_seq1:57-785(+)
MQNLVESLHDALDKLTLQESGSEDDWKASILQDDFWEKTAKDWIKAAQTARYLAVSWDAHADSDSQKMGSMARETAGEAAITSTAAARACEAEARIKWGAVATAWEKAANVLEAATALEWTGALGAVMRAARLTAEGLALAEFPAIAEAWNRAASSWEEVVNFVGAPCDDDIRVNTADAPHDSHGVDTYDQRNTDVTKFSICSICVEALTGLVVGIRISSTLHLFRSDASVSDKKPLLATHS